MNRELRRYLERYDLDEEEYELLSKWVKSGHSVYSNPDEEYDDYGEEVHYIKWYWQKISPPPMRDEKKQLIEAMTPIRETSDTNREINRLAKAQRILRDEIILYRRFLADNGIVREFERYRYSAITGNQQIKKLPES